MNATAPATLIATALSADGDLSGLDVLPLGSETEQNKSCVSVSLEGLEEHEVMLGTHEGRINATLRTVPADTTLVSHSSSADRILSLLCSESWLNAALEPAFKVIESYDPQASMAAEGSARVSEVSVGAGIVENP